MAESQEAAQTVRLSSEEIAAHLRAVANSFSALADHYDALAPDKLPGWLRVAKGEVGVRELPGAGDNPRVVEYHSITRAGEAPDSVPWCASFVGWCLEQVGVASTKSKSARSYLDWGEAITGPTPGCVVVLRRGRAPAGHVGFVASAGMILGGNQRNAVSIRAYSESAVLGYRWPTEQEAA